MLRPNVQINKSGHYGHVANCEYTVLSYWDIVKVYKRLIVMLNPKEEYFIQNLLEMLSSWIIKK